MSYREGGRPGLQYGNPHRWPQAGTASQFTVRRQASPAPFLDRQDRDAYSCHRSSLTPSPLQGLQRALLCPPYISGFLRAFSVTLPFLVLIPVAMSASLSETSAAGIYRLQMITENRATCTLPTEQPVRVNVLMSTRIRT